MPIIASGNFGGLHPKCGSLPGPFEFRLIDENTAYTLIGSKELKKGWSFAYRLRRQT